MSQREAKTRPWVLGLLALASTTGCGKVRDSAQGLLERVQQRASSAPAPATSAGDPAAEADARGALPAPAPSAPPADASSSAPSAAGTSAAPAAAAALPAPAATGASSAPAATGATAAVEAALDAVPDGDGLLPRLQAMLTKLGVAVVALEQTELEVRAVLDAAGNVRHDNDLLLAWAQTFGMLVHTGSPKVVLEIRAAGERVMELVAQREDILAVTTGKRTAKEFFQRVGLYGPQGYAAAAEESAAPAPAVREHAAPAPAQPASRARAARPAASRRPAASSSRAPASSRAPSRR